MTLTLGSRAPAFDLPGVDGNNHSLGDYDDAPALAVIWSCNHCPYVQAWEGRMIEIQRDYADRGIRLVAVSSNDADRYP
jgi:peroxiredoxin